MTRLSDLDRRTYLQGLCGATVLAGGAAVAVGATGNEDEDDGAEADDESADGPNPPARPVLWDVSGTMGFDTVMHYDGDPAHPQAGDKDGSKDHRGERDAEEGRGRGEGAPRKRVVHVTSESEPSGDYAAGLVNLRRRIDADVTLEDVDDGELSYDYYQGPDHEAGAPDEVLLVVQTPDQAEDGTGHALVKHVDDGHDAPAAQSDGEWHTLDVDDEMASGEWRAVEIHSDPDELRVGDDEVAGEVLQRLHEDLGEDEPTEDLFEEYPEETELVGVGFGVGSIDDEVAVDIYYDDLFVDVDLDDDQNPGRGRGRGRGGDDEDHPGQGRGPSEGVTFDFPAALPMDLSFDPETVGTDEDTRARLRFTQEEHGVDRDALVRDSITLHPYTEAAPPVEDGLDAPPGDVFYKDDGYDVEFTGGDIADLDRLGTGDAFVLVTGRLDYEQVVWFLGTAEVTIEDDSS